MSHGSFVGLDFQVLHGKDVQLPSSMYLMQESLLCPIVRRTTSWPPDENFILYQE